MQKNSQPSIVQSYLYTKSTNLFNNALRLPETLWELANAFISIFSFNFSFLKILLYLLLFFFFSAICLVRQLALYVWKSQWKVSFFVTRVPFFNSISSFFSLLGPHIFVFVYLSTFDLGSFVLSMQN